jgi:hypothetical protein
MARGMAARFEVPPNDDTHAQTAAYAALEHDPTAQ